MLKIFFKTAIRNLLKQKTYSFINIIGLALGLAACMVLSLWIRYHLSFDNFHTSSNRMYRPIINTSTPGLNTIHHCGSPGVMADLFRMECPEVESVVRFFRPRQSSRLRLGEHASSHYNIYYTDPNFFDLFSFDLKYGDVKTALQEPNTLVLSEKTYQAFFGDENPVGRLVQLNNQNSVKITGVFEAIPDNSHLQFDFIAPFNPTWLAQYNSDHPMDSDFLSYILLKPGADIKNLESKMDALLEKYYPTIHENVKIYFQPFKKIHLHSTHIEYNQWSYRSADIAMVYVFSAIAILILVIACINYINLTTARATRRAKEVGIRKTIGSTRNQLIAQFLGESILITCLAVIVSGILIEVSSPLLNTLFRNELNITPALLLQSIGWMMLFALVLGVVTGLYPAIYLSMPNPQNLFKPSKSKSIKGFSLRRLLVVIQFCITMILIILSFTIGKQLTWIQNKNLGFNKDQVLSITMPASVKNNYQSIRHQLMEQTSVSEITAMGPHAFSGFQGKTFEFEGSTDNWWSTSCSAVDYNFVEFLDLTITEGRGFSQNLQADVNKAYIINESLKNKLGWDKAVGKRFWIPEHADEWGTVVGVVKDFNFRSLHQPVEGCALFLKPDTLNQIMIRGKAGQFPDLMKTLRQIWSQYAPESAFQYFFFDGHFDWQYRSERRARNVINVFSFWAIFVASIGLLGLISYSTEQRSKEIGLRKVLGASVTKVMLLFSKEYLILMTISVVIAWPVAWMLVNKWLSSFAYRTTIGIGIYFLAWGATLIVAGLIMMGQLVKVATANPVESLKYE